MLESKIQDQYGVSPGHAGRTDGVRRLRFLQVKIRVGDLISSSIEASQS